MPATERPPRSRSATPLLVGMTLGVAALGAAIVMLWPRDKPRPEPTEKPAAQPALPFEGSEQLVSPTEAAGLQVAPKQALKPVEAPAPSPTAATIDLFEGAQEEILSKGHRIVAEGGRLHSKRVKELYNFGQEHPTDARPQLVLALDSMNRGWYGMAAGHYAEAARRDPRAKQDPRIVKDLLFVAGRRHDSAKAQAALLDLFGADALPAAYQAIDEAMSSGDEDRVARLRELVGRMESQAARAP